MIYLKNHLNQTYDYWLITQNQPTLYIELISFNTGQLQNNTVNGAMSITISRVIMTVNCHDFEITKDTFDSIEIELMDFDTTSLFGNFKNCFHEKLSYIIQSYIRNKTIFRNKIALDL